MCRIAQRVAGGRVFQADRRGDVAGVHFLDFFALVRVHLQNTAETFLLVLDRVVARVSPEFITPEYTRKKISWPTNGSVMILNASAENFSSSAARRSVALVVFVSAPRTGGMSTGDGR